MMTETYILAFVNLVLCAVAVVIGTCRLNAMDPAAKVRWPVVCEYAIGNGVMIFSAGRPFIGEWPGYATIGVAVWVIWQMAASAPAWRNNTTPPSATEPAPLQ